MLRMLCMDPPPHLQLAGLRDTAEKLQAMKAEQKELEEQVRCPAAATPPAGQPGGVCVC